MMKRPKVKRKTKVRKKTQENEYPDKDKKAQSFPAQIK